MEIRQGIVTNTKTTDAEAGAAYIVSVDLDGYRVKLEHTVHKPFEITTGDQLAVVGKLKEGVFYAHAFRNMSNGLTSTTQVKAMLCVALVCLTISVALFHFTTGGIQLIALLFGAGAVYSAYVWNITSKGLRQLKLLPKETPKKT
ncbi:hypothetical protein DU002_06095 [Corallincola holothuriorum]|uniref:Uncharacterized protein n=1 Tax=Corallincola holothuriorum TaxID=2282215 RepID=A0A368NML5_9GAMM|nr:hypothetical protein [Corallincola holothuriorum]RCU50894.1 hypothetical protein DU002_06095 [Corallincola holothuriorum]